MHQAGFSALNYVILFVYLGVMVTVGILVAGKQRTTEDYFLAGRKMPWFIVAMSMFASLTSAISYMGVPGTAYKENIAIIVIGAASIMVAPFLAFTFYPIYRRLNVTTSYEYIFYRFGQLGRFGVSGLFLAARLGWLGTVMYAPALALSVVTGINLWLAIVLMGVLATAYTVLGGLSAVLWTDVLQFIMLVGGAIWVAVSLITGVAGGLPEIWQIAKATNHLNVLDMRFSLIEMTGLFVLFSYVFQLMQDYGTDQVSVQRLLAIPNLRGMARAVITNSFFDLSIISLLLFCGIGMFAYYQQHPGLLPVAMAETNQDRILPFYIVNALPNGISGLVITAIFAAAMSSMDSGLNSMSTVVVTDFIRPLRRGIYSEAHDVKLARILTIVLGTFAVGVAFIVTGIEQILAASSTFLGAFAAPILALFLLGIFTRRGKFWGWVMGVVPAILFHFLYVVRHTWLLNGEMVKVHWIYYFPICFGITIIIGYLASLVLPGPLADKQYTVLGRSAPAETVVATEDEQVDSAE